MSPTCQNNFYLMLIIYHISIAVLFFLPIFLYMDVTSRLGVLLLVINVVYLYPLIFNTYYTLEENELFIYQWPFIRKKIKYANIFEITDTLPEGIKKVKRVSLSTPKFFIGYYSYEMDKDTKKEVKKLLRSYFTKKETKKIMYKNALQIYKKINKYFGYKMKVKYTKLLLHYKKYINLNNNI